MAGTRKSDSGSSSPMLAVSRIAVGIMFLFFAEYKLVSSDFARQGYSKYVTGFYQDTALGFYKPFLHWTLQHHMFSGYGVGIAELLIGLSMVLGFWVRPFSILGALFMFNLTLSTWVLPAGTATWRYFGNQLDNIPLMLLFLVFFFHRAGDTWGVDGARAG